MLLHARDIPPSDQPTNTFLALRPPWPIAEEFYSRGTDLCARARIVGSRRPFFILHITLFSIGGAMGRLPYRFLESVDGAVGRMMFPAFDIVLDEARSFETRKASVPFVLEGGELTGVCALRLAALDALRVKDLDIPAARSFSPHLTLAYSRRRSPRLGVAPFEWKACEVQLIESWVGLTKYVELARWPLRDDEPPRSNCPASIGPLVCNQRNPPKNGAA